MANVNHSSLTDPYLHEPKGIAAAAANKVYVSDGAASGSWKTIYTQGWEDYEDDASGAQSLTSGSWVDLTNDGAGSNTNKTYKLPGKGDVWDTSNNQFDFSDYAIGDTLEIRFDVTFATSASNDLCALRVDFAHGDAAEFPLEVFRQAFKSSGNHNVVVSIPFYIGSAAVRDNPAKVAAFADTASDTCTVNGWFIRAIPRTPVFN